MAAYRVQIDLADERPILYTGSDGREWELVRSVPGVLQRRDDTALKCQLVEMCGTILQSDASRPAPTNIIGEPVHG